MIFPFGEEDGFGYLSYFYFGVDYYHFTDYQNHDNIYGYEDVAECLWHVLALFVETAPDEIVKLRWLIDNRIDFLFVPVVEDNYTTDAIRFDLRIRNPDHAVLYKLIWGGA